MFQNPRKVVWNEDRVHPRSQRRIDVGPLTVAYHPRRFAVESMLIRQSAIRSLTLLGEYLHLGKPRTQPGAVQFIVLLREIALGHHVQFVALRQQRQGSLNALQ